MIFIDIMFLHVCHNVTVFCDLHFQEISLEFYNQPTA